VFGERLRQWRKARGLSQLQLALRSDLSQRQLSFLETGRSRPRRDTIGRLCAALDVPLREHNALLVLAGLPPAYAESSFGEATTEPFARALEHTLRAHDPYPGVLVNGWWDILQLNRAGMRMFGDQRGENLAQLLLAEGPLRERIVNWPTVAQSVLGRLRRDARRAPFDARLAQMCTDAEAVVGPCLPDAPSICPTFRVGESQVRTFSLVGELTAAHDITLDELRVELLYPADDASSEVLRSLTEEAGAG